MGGGGESPCRGTFICVICDVMMSDDVMMSNARVPGRPPRCAGWVYNGVYPCTRTWIMLNITLKANIIIKK